MKLVLSTQEVLDAVMGYLESPAGQNLLPDAFDRSKLWARFVTDEDHGEFTGEIEIGYGKAPWDDNERVVPNAPTTAPATK